jgi:hypothetical protein
MHVFEKVVGIFSCKAVLLLLPNKRLVYLAIMMSPKLTNTVVVRAAFKMKHPV